MRLRVQLALPALLAVLGASFGCTGSPIPLSAQAGSTVAIPVGARNTLGPVGYAGLAAEDAQRGELVFALETSTGPFELVTRGTTVVGAGTSTSTARSGIEMYHVLSLVDIPPSAPKGTYDVSVKRVFTDPATGQLVEESIPYDFQLSVLPHQVDVVREDGTPETITGQVTPFERCCGLNGQIVDVTSQVPTITPDPAVRIELDSKVWAVELQLSYPADVIDVLDAYEMPFLRLNDRAATWIAGAGSGSVTVRALATHAPFDDVEVAFALDDPASEILDPSDLSVSVIHAYDQDGAETTVTPTVAGIF